MADTQTALRDAWDDDDLPEDTDDLDEDDRRELHAQLELGLRQIADGVRGRSAEEVLTEMNARLAGWMAART